MLVCDCCFNDIEMQIEICNESPGIGVCDFCSQFSSVIDIEHFSDFFKGVLSLFEPGNEGNTITEIIQNDWNLFASNDVGKLILEYFLNKGGYGFSINDKVEYKSSIRSALSIWEELKKQVREEKRFFTSLSYFDNNKIIIPNTIIPKGTKLYRARVIPSGKHYLTKKEMGCPPKDKATAGRANPIGIPYLYLCIDEATTYYEVRALYLDMVSIGVFEVKENLNILDFTSELSLYYAFNNASDSLDNILCKYKLLQLISRDLSKPLRRFDTELEYVPTQLICEYCKVCGIDGIKFYSSLHKGGVNVVLFNNDSAHCIKVKSKEISRVDISV